jgi:flagellar secretion chaperone FliS
MAAATSYQHARNYMRSQVETASPTQLVVMLYDGAIRFLSLGKERMEARLIEEQNTYLTKAQLILSELISSLNAQKGGEIASNLKRIYIYMIERLVHANMYDDPAAIDEVIALLLDLRESWGEVERMQQRTSDAA